MAEPSEPSGWREYLSLTSDSFGLIGGAVSLLSFLLWLVGLLSGGPFIAAISVGATLFSVWLMGYVFVRNRDPLQSLGTLRDGQNLIQSVSGSVDRNMTLAVKPKPKLTFEIDENESQIRIERGPHFSRIKADIKLRCEKETDSVMAVRGFRLSLHRTEANGQMTEVPHQDESQVIWEDSNGRLVAARDGWTIEKPRTDFRYYSFNVDITPKVQAELSSDYFLQVTMDAIGQDPVSKLVYVKDWTGPEGGFSPIRLKPFEVFPLEAQREISRLNAEAASSEETIERLGRFIEENKSLVDLARKQKAEINNWVKVRDCERGDLTLNPIELTAHPKVRLSIWITNISLLAVAISSELDGVIEFEGSELLEPKKVVNAITNLETGETQCLTIEQRLSDSDISMLRRAEHSTRPLYFNFDRLKLNIIGGKRSPDIPTKPLEIEKHKKALAFPVSPHERLQRVRAFGEIRGACLQLYELLRISEDQAKALPITLIEGWRDRSLETVKSVYKEKGVERLWLEITHAEPIPANASFQRGWLSGCMVVLGGMLEEEAGQYIRSTQRR